MKIPVIDLAVQHRQLQDTIRSALDQVIESGQFVLGPAVSEFERAMAEYHGVRHAVGVASGTDALLLSLIAGGIGPGDEVITTPFTFVATAETIVHAGARPVFVDIDEETYNIDPGKVEERITSGTKALLPVHLYGLPADMEALGALAARRDLKVFEDCAQSTGAAVRGRLTGGLGLAASFSFFPTKNLGGLGDGGMVLTDDDTVERRLRQLRGHGALVRDHYEMLGFNSRLDSLQAAVLSVKLPHLPAWNAMRRENAALYRNLLAEVGPVDLPREPEGLHHVYNQFTIATDRRDELKEHLASRGIGSMVYYSEPLHTQPVFARFGYRAGDFPVSERACRRVLSLPVYPGMTAGQVEEVAGAIRDFFAP